MPLDPETQKRIDSLSGGTPLPQAATDAIAQRLLGPALAQKYGDVLGIRQPGIGDVARDFAVGFMSKDPTKADQIKAAVMEQYNTGLQREETAARAREAADRAKVNSLFSTLRMVKELPKEFRVEALKEGLGKLGFGASPLTMKILANPDKFVGVEELLSPEMIEAAQDRPTEFLAQSHRFFEKPEEAVAFLNKLELNKQARLKTQDMIREARREAEKANLTDTDVARNRLRATLATKPIRTVTGGSRFLTPQEIETRVNEIYPPGSVGRLDPMDFDPNALEGAVLREDAEGQLGAATGIGGTTPTTIGRTGTTTTSTTLPPEAGGIGSATVAPSELAVAAEETPQRVRRITGSVTRIE